ncbi:hypothetical protein B0H16DRAFT_1571982 [Mycena metata]|uniref:Uncharacterized protein n=1 Tax=Mycena metata TaxID=1033252 RepID=A0AAD7MYG5_9AGAR|nr:hypothetical protein B0H16DRAFT_1571982 [Mycena metata]
MYAPRARTSTPTWAPAPNAHAHRAPFAPTQSAQALAASEAHAAVPRRPSSPATRSPSCPRNPGTVSALKPRTRTTNVYTSAPSSSKETSPVHPKGQSPAHQRMHQGLCADNDSRARQTETTRGRFPGRLDSIRRKQPDRPRRSPRTTPHPPLPHLHVPPISEKYQRQK